MQNNILQNLKKGINHNKNLLVNFSFLTILQIFNLLSPLIVYPYLIKTLGSEIYGKVLFAQAIVSYIVIIVSFGFNLTAAREVSVNRHNNEKLSEILSSVIIIKTILAILALTIVLLGLEIFGDFSSYKTLILLTMWMVIYDIMFPQWYFQGIEKMKYITYINVISRFIFLGFVFLLIKSENDYLLVPLINGIGAIFSGFVAFYIITKKHRIKLTLKPIKTLTYYLKDSFTIFISTFSINVYKSTNKVIIGSLLGMTQVAYYDLAEKIITLSKVPQNILNQTIFPKTSKEKDVKFLKKILKISVTFNSIIYIILVISAKYLVIFLGGLDSYSAVIVVYILGLTIPIIAIGNIFGFQSLVAFGYMKDFTTIVVASGFIYFFQLFSIWNFSSVNIQNLSIITLTTEIITTSYLYFQCKKKKIW